MYSKTHRQYREAYVNEETKASKAAAGLGGGVTKELLSKHGLMWNATTKVLEPIHPAMLYKYETPDMIFAEVASSVPQFVACIQRAIL